MLHYNKMNSVKRHKENIYLKLHSMLGKFDKSEVIFFFFFNNNFNSSNFFKLHLIEGTLCHNRTTCSAPGQLVDVWQYLSYSSLSAGYWGMTFPSLTFQSGGHNHKPKLPSRRYGCPAWHGQLQIYGSLPVSGTSPLGLKKTKWNVRQLIGPGFKTN